MICYFYFSQKNGQILVLLYNTTNYKKFSESTQIYEQIRYLYYLQNFVIILL